MAFPTVIYNVNIVKNDINKMKHRRLFQCSNMLNDRHKKLMVFEVFKELYAGLSLLSLANSRMKIGLVGCFELH